MPGNAAVKPVARGPDDEIGVTVVIQVGNRHGRAEAVEVTVILLDQPEFPFGEHLHATVGEIQIDGPDLGIAG